jgi:ABC-type bacteriocin/lantibiotic exporter with double-glycine peptidase domain
MQQGYGAGVQLLGNWGILDDLLDVLEAPVSSQSLSAPSAPLPFERAIEFHGVSFQYQPTSSAVLRDINFVIPKGSRVGVVGKTGSGKSTFADLVMGLLEPTEGRITVDTVELTGRNRQAWHRAVAHVPQSIYLSDASIAENIAFGVPIEKINMQRVWEAVRQAELSVFVKSLPQGVDTFVGERGIRLSGGQRQRIGIARALYKDPMVLILDEATSALDTDTEAAIMRSIDQLHRELTIVIVAHRHSTLYSCDFIIGLEGGVINPADLSLRKVSNARSENS